MSAANLALVRASLETHGKSFSFASTALGQSLRDDTAAVYAFCRRADDAVDTAGEGERKQAIDSLDAELESIYSAAPQSDPVLSAFQEVVRRYRVPRHYPGELLRGMRMDVEGKRYGSLPELLDYCYAVAGTVGLMMCHVLGVSDGRALRHAAHLGMAMQLTNICRDVREDWQLGRLYLPRDLIVGFGAPPIYPDGGGMPESAAPAIATTVRFLLTWADALYASGERGIAFLPWRAALAVRTARLVYADIGRVILERDADPFAARAVVSKPRKVALGILALSRTLLESRPDRRRAELTSIIGANDVLCL